MCESLGALRCADINGDLRATLEKALSSRATQAASGARNQHDASGEVLRHLSALLTVNYSSYIMCFLGGGTQSSCEIPMHRDSDPNDLGCAQEHKRKSQRKDSSWMSGST